MSAAAGVVRSTSATPDLNTNKEGQTSLICPYKVIPCVLTPHPCIFAVRKDPTLPNHLHKSLTKPCRALYSHSHANVQRNVWEIGGTDNLYLL